MYWASATPCCRKQGGYARVKRSISSSKPLGSPLSTCAQIASPRMPASSAMSSWTPIVALSLIAGHVWAAEDQCQLSTPPSSPESNARVHGRIIDISKELTSETHTWDSPSGLGENFRERYTRIEDGDLANQSQLKDLPVHLATHVDAAGHFVHESYLTGVGVENLDLYVLNGPALVVEIPDDTNITAAALEALYLPTGVERLIFKTLNTKRRLMHQRHFISDYTSMTLDGAEWLVENTDIQLVGIDYTSIAFYDDLKGPHVTLLPRDVVVVEGLVLDDVSLGIYDLHCLPLKIVGSDGSPARCILIT